MASNSIVAPHIVLIGDALKPALRKIEARLNEPAPPMGTAESFRNVSERVLAQVSAAARRLVDEVNDLGRIMQAPDAPDAQVHRAVGRLEMVLDELLESFADVRRACPPSAHEHGRHLLLAAMRRILTQIEWWLRDVVDATADPKAVLRRRGMPTSGKVELNLMLELDGSPEMDEFRNWLIVQGELEGRKKSRWNGLAALAAGVFLGGVLFGGDDD